MKTKGRGTGIKHQNKDRDKRGECLQVILEEAHNLLKSQEGIDWRQGKLMILGESTGVYIPEEEAGPCDWGCPCDGDSHADGPVSMGNRMAQVVTCCDPLLPSTPPGLRLCMTSFPSQPQSRLHYSTHVMCHMVSHALST